MVQDEKEVLPPTLETSATTSANASHGIEVVVEFKSVEHPNEPLITTDQFSALCPNLQFLM